MGIPVSSIDMHTTGEGLIAIAVESSTQHCSCTTCRNERSPVIAVLIVVSATPAQQTHALTPLPIATAFLGQVLDSDQRLPKAGSVCSAEEEPFQAKRSSLIT